MPRRKADPQISQGTLDNWARLGTDASGRLESRANKRLSQKHVVPGEYAERKENARAASFLASRIEASGYGTMEAFWSLCQNLLGKAGMAGRDSCRKALSEYKALRTYQDLLNADLPAEPDILGLIYECCLSEGLRNESGCYYTPRGVASEMLGGMDLKGGASFLDPCCGSGAFLLAAEAPDPGQLCGIDIDPVAVMLARTNLLLKYRDLDFVPDIRRADFLDDFEDLGGRQFDFIATNPPWGAAHKDLSLASIESGESASLVLAKACSMLREGGTACFLLPEAALNVKAHRDLRAFMLERVDLRRIRSYGSMFSGVMTGFAAITVNKGAPSGRPVEAVTANGERGIDPEEFRQAPNLVFSLMSEIDARIVRKCRQMGAHSLRDSTWALGIVTGDNKRLLSGKCEDGMEPIYTGKEIRPYRLLEPSSFIRYDRSAFQQAAPDAIYRTRVKLAYKFISDKPAFACDRNGSLFLNSANLLIPNIPGMGALSVMAILNSSLTAFLYRRMFGEVKILKGNLMELPFPAITKEQDEELSRLADAASRGDEQAPAQIDALVLGIFGLDDEERTHVAAQAAPKGRRGRKPRQA